MARTGDGRRWGVAVSYKLHRVSDPGDINRPTAGTGEAEHRAVAVADAPEQRCNLIHIKDLPPIEVTRRPGESAVSAAQRFLDVQFGCYGD